MNSSLEAFSKLFCLFFSVYFIFLCIYYFVHLPATPRIMKVAGVARGQLSTKRFQKVLLLVNF